MYHRGAMATRWVPLLRWTFKGDRFREHGIDLKDLRALVASREIIVAFAKDIWLRENESSERAPKNFDDKIELQLFHIGEGSSVVEISFKARAFRQEGLFSSGADRIVHPTERKDIRTYIPEASRMFTGALSDMQSGRTPPFRIDPSVLRHFKVIGASLRGAEHVHVEVINQLGRSPTDAADYGLSSVCVDIESRRAVSRRVKDISPTEAAHEQALVVDFSGNVSGTVVGRGDGPMMLHITGRGQFDPESDKLKKIVILDAEKASESPLRDTDTLLSSDAMNSALENDVYAHVRANIGPESGVIAAELARALGNEFTLPDVVQFAGGRGYNWEDVQAVVEYLASGRDRWIERVFLTADTSNPKEVAHDEVLARLRASLTNETAATQWREWSSRIRVVWRWAQRRSTQAQS